jgi:hypothetical protein
MRLSCGLMEGQIWDASVQPSPEGVPEGGITVLLSNEEILSPENAEWGEFSIVEATPEEREALKAAGYSMPDWDPLQGLGCGECHLGHGEDEGQIGDSGEQQP